VQVKVFACQIHGECAIGKQLAGIKCCAACEDYEQAAGGREGWLKTGLT
jgi:hypothetical protein